MPPDVELYELTAGGLTEPQAQWTEAAKGNLADAITAIIEERDADLVPFAAVGDDPLTPHPYTQVVKLHEAVGRTILVHGYLPGLSLPTRKDRFDWSLGPDVVPMGEAYQADYALFVYARESFSTSGRVALVIIGALLGAYVPGGQQVGFASLVDLRSGDLVWFNQATAAIGGPARTGLGPHARREPVGRPAVMSPRTALGAALALLLAGCATAPLEDIEPGERPSIESEEASLWMMMDRVEGNLKTSGRVVDDPALNAYVSGLVCRLAGPYCGDVRVYVVRAAGFNASMAPNGSMRVWTGLLLRSRNEAQLAFVLGHELGHYLRRHSLQALARDTGDDQRAGLFQGRDGRGRPRRHRNRGRPRGARRHLFLHPRQRARGRSPRLRADGRIRLRRGRGGGGVGGPARGEGGGRRARADDLPSPPTRAERSGPRPCAPWPRNTTMSPAATRWRATG